MPLVASQTEGLWINPRWDPNKPGIFAVVIGVSKYDHLTGDDQSYGLGQLYVSALTAYRFFSWLKEEYRHPDLPLAKVWLLLAPTDAEIQEEPSLQQTKGYCSPTFLNCKQAIGEWFATIQALNSLVSEKSRTLFFFSGHGLEVTREKQILLPCDYLEPPGLVNWALSTYNLWTGMGATPVPEHFFFLDACRNDHEKLKGLGIEGTQVLNPCLSGQARTDAISPIVHATGPGAAAWAPVNPKDGISVFGQALLECLECHAGVQAWYDNNHYWVTFRQLEDYLSPRVAQILERAGLRIKQPVQITFAAGKTPICVVPSSRVGPTRGAPLSATAIADALPRVKPVALPQGWRGPADSKSVGDLWGILHSESVTNLFWEARVYDLKTRQWTSLTNNMVTKSLVLREIARTDDRNTYQIEVEMQQSSSQWFEVTIKNQTAACLLIADKDYLPCYSLRFDFIMDPSEGRLITGLDVSLASSSQGVVGEAAKLWNQYRGSDIGKEGTPAEFTLLERQLYGKCESPLAATVAALLLLRAWRPDLLHNWLKNLANWFPERPDGWVIWVEQVLRTKQEKGLDEAIAAFLKLEKLPLPLTSEGLGHASRQVGELLKFAFPKPENQTAEQKTRYEALEKLQQRLNRALAVFRPGGFGTVFIGPAEAVTPDLILPY